MGKKELSTMIKEYEQFQKEVIRVKRKECKHKNFNLKEKRKRKIIEVYPSIHLSAKKTILLQIPSQGYLEVPLTPKIQSSTCDGNVKDW